MITKRILLLWLIISAGLIMGIYHFKVGTKALFVFRQNEPITSWITIICGPLSSFPAVVVGIINKRAGSIWLITGSLISFVSFAIQYNFEPDNLLPFFFMFNLPMIVIGSGFWLLKKN